MIGLRPNSMRAIEQPSFRAHQPSTAVLALVAMSLILMPDACRAWGLDGHQITAYIAADHLSPIARRHLAQILEVADNPTAVAGAMARAAGPRVQNFSA